MRKYKFFRLVGLVLIVIGLFLTGYNIFQESAAVESSKFVLDKLKMRQNNDENIILRKCTLNDFNSDVVDKEIYVPDYVINPDMHMPKAEISGCNYIGTIEIPSEGKVLPVSGECDFSKIKECPCAYSGTAYLNNFIIVACNYKTHFGSIDRLPFGEVISFRDLDGNFFNYSVVEKENISGDIEEISSDNWDLTLITSSIGGRSAMVVRCE